MEWASFAKIALIALWIAPASTRPGQEASATEPPGEAKTGKTRFLEAGAKALQSRGPAGKFDMYMVGFHPLKADPAHAMEAHHYCHQANEDFAQCVLFDGNAPDANLDGIEYIISAKLFETLPPEEREYWHPHNYEILSGQLVMPGLPDAAEKRAMKSKVNSYGKTWHIWDTGTPGEPGDRLPLGEPKLAWSYNADGEIPPSLAADLEKRTGIRLAEKRKQRADLVRLAEPQAGVDALRDAFPKRMPIPGVANKDSMRATPASAPKNP